MKEKLTSKIAIAIYLLALIGLSFWAYTILKARTANAPTVAPQSFSSDSSQSIASTDDLVSDNDTDNQATPNDNIQPTTNDKTPATLPEINSSPTSSNQKNSGPILANITQEHCNTNCQAFSIDLTLKEYCEEACGISPVKDVTSCDDKKGIQKDYCTKDLAITKNDSSICENISDTNIKQACKNRIAQDIIESM
jgi:hypothetical protein